MQDEEQRKGALLAEANALVGQDRGMPRDFLQLLFSRGAAEDLLTYSASELVELASSCAGHLASRLPGKASIRVFNPQGDSARFRNISIIEIVNDNMPFLVDSVRAELDELGLHIRLIVHPILNVERDPSGRMVSFFGDGLVPSGHDGLRESLIHIHVDRIGDEGVAEAVASGLERTLADVRLVVGDWKPMLARIDEVINGLKNLPPPIPVAELAEAIQFLEWLRDNNFTFLGLREYEMRGKGTKAKLEPLETTGLGVLRDAGVGLLRRGRDDGANMPPEVRHFLKKLSPLIISKANLRSKVHRRVPLDYIGIKLFDAKGELTGELRLAGLFTSTAYTRSARVIPYLRRKVEILLGKAGFDPESHSGKALVNIVENFPRDELFQIDDETLFDFTLRVLQLDERPRIRVLHRFDKFGRFVSVLVYIPRERYTTSTRVKIADELAARFGGQVMAWNAAYPEGPLARLHFTIEKGNSALNVVERPLLEAEVTRIVRTFEDQLLEAMFSRFDVGAARGLKAKYAKAFSPAYQEHYSADEAITDLGVMERLAAGKQIAINFHRDADDAPNEVALKVYHRGSPIPLSERVPVIEAMGFRAISESSFEITPADEEAVVLHDIRLVRADGQAMDFAAADGRLEAAFLAVWSGLAENDGFNALVAKAALEWRDVALLRAISRYLRQALIPYSQDYMWATMTKHSSIAADVVALFHARFTPAQDDRDSAQAAILARIESALSAVTSLDEDRILRRFVNVVQSMLRTNFYQRASDGALKPTIAFKLDSKKVLGLPDPRPMVEIFVYSPRVEGVHLRFGRIARGGLRWSDRPQDFRTEVLGLVKAQQVKNAVIVPVGAKGGFVPKWLPAGPREAVQAEGVAAYKLFVSSLLDMTDNIDAKGTILVRDNIVRHDGDDPYLVVAADKGTATFSDIANGISDEYGHWLGDAFASGGSVGYDHKKMGITARGAWEAVKRHFREIDIDIQTTPFTVVGVGDMSGDVFGNGMLLSEKICLLAAFDHRDIFIDPTPDPATSFAERTRMFALPRSSWQDYNKSLISAGGGVFPRSAKSITLSKEAQAAIGLAKDEATPQEIMTAILKAKADLLWFGGIGTYIRATTETDAEAGDRANDAIRITAPELRCRAIGEGANLGMTQKARIEAAKVGVRINTDAIDNSAGVNSSDVEVNIKIALGSVVRSGRLSTKSRNKLLAEMTPDVASLVLRNNILQTLSLSLAQRRGAEDIGFAQRLMQTLEADGRLDRKVEYLPDDRELDARLKRNEGLSRPELSVLLAYAKLSLHDALLESDVPDDVYLAREVVRYFPAALQAKYPKALEHHRLRREIISTMLANSMINRGGPTLLPRIADQTGAAAPEIAAAFAAVRDAYGMTALNNAIDALDNKIAGKLQLKLFADVQALLLDRIVWFLRNGSLHSGLTQVVRRFGDGIAAVDAALETALPDAAVAQLSQDRAELVKKGVPEELARRLVALPHLADAPDVVLVASGAKVAIESAAKVYFGVADLFALGEIASAAKALPVTGYYERLALDRAISSLAASNRRIASAVLKAGGMAGWMAKYGALVERSRAAMRDIANGADLTVAKLSVAAGLLADLADA